MGLLEKRTADAVAKNLKALGIARLAEWDVIAFIYHHGTSLASAEKIARLIGHSKAEVGSALDSLTSMGLVQRSRNSRGVRIYQFTAAVADDFRQRALEELIKLAGERQGRLLVVRHLRQADDGKDLRERCGLHLA